MFNKKKNPAHWFRFAIAVQFVPKIGILQNRKLLPVSQCLLKGSSPARFNIRYQRKVIRIFGMNKLKLFYFKIFVGKNIIDAQGGRNKPERAANEKPFFKKCILQVIPDSEVCATVRHVIKIATQ